MFPEVGGNGTLESRTLVHTPVVTSSRLRFTPPDDLTAGRSLVAPAETGHRLQHEGAGQRDAAHKQPGENPRGSDLTGIREYAYCALPARDQARDADLCSSSDECLTSSSYLDPPPYAPSRCPTPLLDGTLEHREATVNGALPRDVLPASERTSATGRKRPIRPSASSTASAGGRNDCGGADELGQPATIAAVPHAIASSAGRPKPSEKLGVHIASARAISAASSESSPPATDTMRPGAPGSSASARRRNSLVSDGPAHRTTRARARGETRVESPAQRPGARGDVLAQGDGRDERTYGGLSIPPAAPTRARPPSIRAGMRPDRHRRGPSGGARSTSSTPCRCTRT